MASDSQIKNQTRNDVAIVQLGRYGDIVNVLPIAYEWYAAGKTVHWYVDPQFEDIFEATSYIEPVVFRGGVMKCEEAAIEARKRFEHVVITQGGQKTDPNQFTKSYAAQQWERADCLPYFHAWPLIFDREPAFDPTYFWGKLAEPKKPVLAYCLNGRSSPHPHPMAMSKWIVETFTKEFELVDLATLRCRTICEVLPILRRCAVLLSTDTLHIHLARATATPTIVMGRGTVWADSEARPHFIHWTDYADSMTNSGRARIAAAVKNYDKIPFGLLCRDPKDMIDVARTLASRSELKTTLM